MKRKIFILFTSSLTTIGGGEMYTAGKAQYLKKLGWEVYTPVMKKTEEGKEALIPSLKEYVKLGEGWLFLSVPPYRFKRQEQDFLLELMIQRFNLQDYNNCEIIIETFQCWGSASPLWAELLASKIGARHFSSITEENHRYPGNCYEDNLDFFYFKWRRNELIGGSEQLKSLFKGYRNVFDPLVEMPYTTHEQDAVQDIDFPKINEIKKLDWNICHIGRWEKKYVMHAIKGVAELAKRYPTKEINFMFVGDVDYIKNDIFDLFKPYSNVQFTFLGILVPIPKVLFSKIDVVCAISQTARFAAEEGVLTIVASAEHPKKTPGLLGYDTDEQIHGEPTFTYVEALENVLVNRAYDDKKYNLPKLLPAEHYYENFWTIVKNADPKKEYYIERLSQDRIRHWFAVFPFGQIARGTKIILFGATEIAVDYRRQVESQQDCNFEISPSGVKKLSDEPYCYIIATVDEHPEKFDDSVVGLERLKTVDYDAIVITTYSNKADETREKILEIVPQMADRIICNLQFRNVYWMEHKQVKYIDF